MNFSIEQLLAFVTVYEQLSFSKAAIKLNKHRTTIGQVISNLEDQLAVTLFERVGRAVEPTEDGRLLYHYAKQILEQARVFDKVALSLSYGRLECITIASTPLIPLDAMTAIRQKLIEDFPTMRVNCVLKDKSEIKQGITSGDIHFGLVNIHESQGIHSFDSTFLGHIELIPYTRRDSEILTMDYADTISALKLQRQFLLKPLADEGLKDKLVLSPNYEEVDTVALIVKMVREGMGWAWLPKNLELSDVSSKYITPIGSESGVRTGFKFPIALWCPHSKQIDSIKKSVVSVLKNHIKPDA